MWTQDVFVKKNLRFHKFPDTCGRRLKVPSYNSSCPPANKCWIERYINEDRDIFSSCTTKIYNYLKIDGKDNKHTWKGVSFRATSSNRKGRSRVIFSRWPPFLQGLEVYCSIDLHDWNSGYGTRTQPKNDRNNWTLSENSLNSGLVPCCDVTRLSNLITVPDCVFVLFCFVVFQSLCIVRYYSDVSLICK